MTKSIPFVYSVYCSRVVFVCFLLYLRSGNLKKENRDEI